MRRPTLALAALVFAGALLVAGFPAAAETDGDKSEARDAEFSRRLVLEALERTKALVKEERYEEAAAQIRPVFDRVHELQGEDLTLAGTVVEVLAEVLHRAGRDVELADRSQLLELIALQEKALGPDHPALGKVLAELACLSQLWRDVPEAEHFYRRLFRLQENTNDRIGAARTLNYMGMLFLESGDLGRTREILEEAMAILEQELGTFEQILELEGLHGERALYAELMSSLGVAVVSTGDLARGDSLIQQARQIYARVLDPNHLTAATMDYYQAHVAMRSGRSAEAVELLRRMERRWRQGLGEESLYVGVAQAALGQALAEVGELEEALAMLVSSLRILQAGLGADAYRTAIVHRRLGELYRRQGEPERALRHYRRSIEIHASGPFQIHPEAALSLDQTARLLHAMGRFDEAFDTALQAESQTRACLATSFNVLAERQALYVQGERARGTDTALTLLAEGRGDAYRAWDTVVRSRALVLDEIASRHGLLGDSGHPKIEAQRQELARARRQLAALYVSTVDHLANPRRLPEALQRRDAAESALADTSSAFRRRLRQRRGGLAEVIEALPQETALVAFVRYEHLAHGSPKAPENGAGTPSYLAFVHPPSPSSEPSVVAVPLGPADSVDGAVEQFLAWIVRHSESRFLTASRRLRQMVWDPIAPFVGSAERILVVPDAELNRVQWAALVMKNDRYWVEDEPPVHLLSAERDLATPDGAGSDGNFLSLGGVDFDALPALQPDSVPVSEGAVAELSQAVPGQTRGSGLPCDDFFETRYPHLAGSAAEARQVADLARTFLTPVQDVSIIELSGADADEAAFRTLAPLSRYLHLATHGFVLNGDSCPSPDADSRAAEEVSPLLLSGLVLAGANQRRRARVADGDGILTAEEIATLDLSSVKLVVLSACDTALGRAVPGEGVLGLRRAFRVAGARSLLSSLWPVDDTVAGPWMNAFYRAHLGDGLDLPSAAHHAARQVLEARRRRGQDTHPYYWAPFVTEGRF